MLKGAENQTLYREHHEIMKTDDARNAYSFLVGWSSSLKDFECMPNKHGEVRDFQFWVDGNYYFAFIPNQQWLLFYFRIPSQRNKKFSRDAIFQHFPEASENNKGEFTIKVKDLKTALKVASYIES
jgi:hypothetical protein